MMSIQTEKFKQKGQFFGAPYLRQLKSNCLTFSLKNVHLFTKYLLPEKISLLTSLQAEIKGKRPPPSLFRLTKGPAFGGLIALVLNFQLHLRKMVKTAGT